jgi:hypothetical protein
VNSLKQPNRFLDDIRYLLALLVCCLIAYYPLTFHLFSLKNDALNYFLPVRYQISEAISNGYVPFWSPYFNLGYPLHGDMQSGVWNPFVQFFSLFGPYTLKTLQYETLLYVYLSGVGMFCLIDHLIKNKKIALFGAVAFMLCGYNSDSAQFLNWISAASFLPFVFLFYHRTLQERSLLHALFCSFFIYLLFVTAYPADFIITIYILFFYLLYHLIQDKKYKNKETWRPLFKTHLLIAFCFLLLSLPAIISFYQFLPLSERGNGASYSDAMSNPFHPLLLFSYVTPFGVWKAPYVSATDPLERNSFFGLVSFVLLIASFFVRFDNPIIRFSRWAFVITLIFSFGEMGGLRTIAYYALPMMNSFRHPANAKLFTIFFACVLASYALLQAYQNQTVKKKSFVLATLLAFAIVVASFSYQLPTFSGIHFSKGSVQGLKSMIDNSSFSDLIAINIFLQLPFFIAVYFFFVKKSSLNGLLYTSIVNCVLHTMLFQPFTVVKKDSAATIQSVLDEVQQNGYPLPQLNISLQSNSKDGYSYFKEIGAANMYNKKIGRIDYRITPSNLNWQNEFWFDTTTREALLHYPLIYKADSVVLYQKQKMSDIKEKKMVLLDNIGPVNAINSLPKTNASINVINFSPQQFAFTIESNSAGFYSLFQNYYPRWKLLIDGKPATITKINIAFMGFSLPAGKHEVVFQYKKWDLVIAFLISTLLSLTIIGIALRKIFKSSSPS